MGNQNKDRMNRSPRKSKRFKHEFDFPHVIVIVVRVAVPPARIAPKTIFVNTASDLPRMSINTMHWSSQIN